MAVNYKSQIENFNPYVSQIPTDVYAKVGMFKENAYNEGVQKIQSTIDNIAGLDIANAGGKAYLQQRVSELTSGLNTFGYADFANTNNVKNMQGLAAPIYNDQNIQTDVANTMKYRAWDKDSKKKLASGDMEASSFWLETNEASEWLGSNQAGKEYTGRAAANDSTKLKFNDKVVKFMDKLKPDTRYDMSNPHWIMGDKTYDNNQVKNYILNNIMDSKDREMFMADHLYQNGADYSKDPTILQGKVLKSYQDKIDVSKARIGEINLALTAKKLDPQQESTLKANRSGYETNIQNAGLAIQSYSNPKIDPTKRSSQYAFAMNLSTNQVYDNLDVLMPREQLKPEPNKYGEMAVTQQYQIINTGLTKGSLMASVDKNGNPTVSGVFEEDGKTPTYHQLPLDPNKNLTTVDANGNTVTTATTKAKALKKGADRIFDGDPEEVAGFNRAGIENIVGTTLNELTGEYDSSNSVVVGNLLGIYDNLVAATAGTEFDIRNYAEKRSVNTPGGYVGDKLEFRSVAKQKEYLNFMHGLTVAVQQESKDGSMKNQSFKSLVESFADEAKLAAYGDNPDTPENEGIGKEVAHMLKSSGNALVGSLDKLFKDDKNLQNIINIDNAISRQNKLVGVTRQLFSSNAGNPDEKEEIKNMSVEKLMSLKYIDFANPTNSDLKFKEQYIRMTDVGEGKYDIEAVGDDGNGNITTNVLLKSIDGKGLTAKNAKDKFDTFGNNMRSLAGNPLTGGIGRALGLTTSGMISSLDRPNAKKSNGDIILGIGTGTDKNGGDIAQLTKTVIGQFSKDYSVLDNTIQGKAMTSGGGTGISKATVEAVQKRLANTYTTINENVTRSMTLLGEDPQALKATTDAIQNSLIGQGGSVSIMQDPSVIRIDGGLPITGVTSVKLLGATNKKRGSFFNTEAWVNVEIEGNTIDKDNKPVKTTTTAQYNMDRILKTDPDFKQKHSQYFMPLKYAGEAAASELEAQINPLRGGDPASGYGNGRRNTYVQGGEKMVDSYAKGEGFNTMVVKNRSGENIPLSYKIVSYGGVTDPTGNGLQKNQYYISLQIPTPSGPKNIILRDNSKTPRGFATHMSARALLGEELFSGDVPIDSKNGMIKNSKTGKMIANPFVRWDPNNKSLTGFWNTQLELNGETVPTLESMKQQIADITSGKTAAFGSKETESVPFYSPSK